MISCRVANSHSNVNAEYNNPYDSNRNRFVMETEFEPYSLYASDLTIIMHTRRYSESDHCDGTFTSS